MRLPNENALTPVGLATDGEQGESANARRAGEVKHTGPEGDALILALSATDEARAYLQRYGGLTDTPAPGTVEAADLLDAARLVLAEVTP